MVVWLLSFVGGGGVSLRFSGLISGCQGKKARAGIACSSFHPPTHLPTVNQPTYASTHSPTHTPIHPPTRPPTHIPTHPRTHTPAAHTITSSPLPSRWTRSTPFWKTRSPLPWTGYGARRRSSSSGPPTTPRRSGSRSFAWRTTLLRRRLSLIALTGRSSSWRARGTPSRRHRPRPR